MQILNYIQYKKIFFLLLAVFCLTPWCNSSLGLILGIFCGVVIGNPFILTTKKLTPKMLAYSIVGLGAGMNLKVIGEVGARGIGYTVSGILFVALLGFIFFKLLKVSKDTSVLVTVGTAICGGSAIAAVAPILKAKDEDISISLAVVFLLNSLALLIFPFLGHHFHLTQEQFGLWSALAIHDTSSVVGATMQYGAQAMQVGTTVKLARALWIVPVSLCVATALRWGKNNSHKENKSKIKKPWFVLGFVLMASLFTFLPGLHLIGAQISVIAKQVLVLTLFLIGAGINKKSIKEVGANAFTMGVGLWSIVAVVALLAIMWGYIKI